MYTGPLLIRLRGGERERERESKRERERESIKLTGIPKQALETVQVLEKDHLKFII